jgi:hypothetical protein
MIIDRIRASGQGVAFRAADVAVALTSGGVHDSLVGESGWTHDEYESWLAHTLVEAVLAEEGRACVQW